MLLDRRGDEGPTLTAQIHVFGTAEEVDDRSFYVTGGHVLVTLRFSRVELYEIVEFNRRNVLFSLEVSEPDPGGDGGYRVDMNLSSGCGASFECRAVKVILVGPPDQRRCAAGGAGPVSWVPPLRVLLNA